MSVEPVYAMTALQRDSRASASEAAMKYFILGALAIRLAPVWHLSMIYGATGSASTSRSVFKVVSFSHRPHHTKSC